MGMQHPRQQLASCSSRLKAMTFSYCCFGMSEGMVGAASVSLPRRRFAIANDGNGVFSHFLEGRQKDGPPESIWQQRTATAVAAVAADDKCSSGLYHLSGDQSHRRQRRFYTPAKDTLVRPWGQRAHRLQLWQSWLLALVD